MSEKSQNTNLASEFYVLSTLHRLGVNATLTLGNKKAVDIVVEKGGKTLTMDVKGLQGTTSFPIDKSYLKTSSHFFVFVSYLDKFEDVNVQPEIFIVPSDELEKKHKELDDVGLVWHNEDRKVVMYNRLKKLAKKYQNKWGYIVSRS
jgi:hypothetical protein